MGSNLGYLEYMFQALVEKFTPVLKGTLCCSKTIMFWKCKASDTAIIDVHFHLIFNDHSHYRPTCRLGSQQTGPAGSQ